jgi:hypothetical protein
MDRIKSCSSCPSCNPFLAERYQSLVSVRAQGEVNFAVLRPKDRVIGVRSVGATRHGKIQAP